MLQFNRNLAARTCASERRSTRFHSNRSEVFTEVLLWFSALLSSRVSVALQSIGCCCWLCIFGEIIEHSYTFHDGVGSVRLNLYVYFMRAKEHSRLFVVCHIGKQWIHERNNLTCGKEGNSERSMGQKGEWRRKIKPKIWATECVSLEYSVRKATLAYATKAHSRLRPTIVSQFNKMCVR